MKLSRRARRRAKLEERWRVKDTIRRLRPRTPAEQFLEDMRVRLAMAMSPLVGQAFTSPPDPSVVIAAAGHIRQVLEQAMDEPAVAAMVAKLTQGDAEDEP